MCGRFALSITPARFRDLFGCPPPAGYAARWNIAPDSEVPVIFLSQGHCARNWSITVNNLSKALSWFSLEFIYSNYLQQK